MVAGDRRAPMRTSPTLKTFAHGTTAGMAKMSVSGRSAGFATTTLLVLPVTSKPGGRQRRGIGGHPAAVREDRGEVAAGTDRHERDPGDGEVPEHGREDDEVRGDVDRRAGVADQRAERLREDRELDNEARRPRARPSGTAGRARPPIRPPSSSPTTMPTGIATRTNTGGRLSRRPGSAARIPRAARHARRGGRRRTAPPRPRP